MNDRPRADARSPDPIAPRPLAALAIAAGIPILLVAVAFLLANPAVAIAMTFVTVGVLAFRRLDFEVPDGDRDAGTADRQQETAD